MHIKIEVQGHGEGEYQAYRPEVWVSCRGRSVEDVLERIKNLLALHFSGICEDQADRLPDEEAELTRRLSLYVNGKNLLVPRDRKSFSYRIPR